MKKSANKNEYNKNLIMAKGIYTHCLHSATGNGRLLVVTDSNASWHNWSIVRETVLLALEHFGFPYQTIDLAKQRLGKADLMDCAALVGSHECGARLCKPGFVK